MFSPLVSVAVSYVKQAAPNVFNQLLADQMTEAFTAYLSGTLDQRSLSELLISTIGSTAPLEKINAILRVPDTPLMPQPVQRENANSLRKKSRPWTPIEDNRLLAGMHRFGMDNWAAISTFVGNGRTRAQCAQRWFRGLDPRICKDQWTPEEEARLLALLRSGKNRGWTAIAMEMGNRSDVQCRYHFLQMQRDRKIGDEFREVVDRHAIPLPAKRPQIFEKIPQGLRKLPLMQAPTRLTSSQPNLALQLTSSPPATVWAAVPRQEPLGSSGRRRTSSHVDMKPPPVVEAPASLGSTVSDEDMFGMFDLDLDLDEGSHDSVPDWGGNGWSGASDGLANPIW